MRRAGGVAFALRQAQGERHYPANQRRSWFDWLTTSGLDGGHRKRDDGRKLIERDFYPSLKAGAW